jgi:MipA family protein
MRSNHKFKLIPKYILSGLAVAALQVVGAGLAAAGDVAADKDTGERSPKDWNFVLGGGGAYAPDYEGSNDYKFSFLPVVSASYKNLVFVDGPSARVNVLGFFGEDFPVMAGPSISYDFGRSHKDNNALRKLGDVDGGANIGGFIGSQLGPVQFGVNYTRELGNNRKGSIADFAVNFAQPIGDQLTASIGANAAWTDKDYMQEYFGITSAQALNSGYAKYDGKAGFKSVGVNIGLDYMINEHIGIGAGVSYTKLLDNASDSPIVKQQGSADQYMASITTSFRF